MAIYVDGYVLPVPIKKVAAYRKMASRAGKVTSFPQAVKLKEGETVVFAWITYKSRKDRDRVNAMVMKDPRMAKPAKDMPMDPVRMFFGGFKSIVEY